MPLPETIPVRFTEEEAEYVSIRPVRRQIFKLRELVDMVLSVTGRDLPRVQQILRTGTIVFHFYRYWWQGFETDAGGNFRGACGISVGRSDAAHFLLMSARRLCWKVR